MKRRTFLTHSAMGMALAGTHGSLFGYASYPGQSQTSMLKPEQHLTWKIHPDGSFDIRGGSFSISGCYPFLEDSPLHPLSVEISNTPVGGTIRYLLAEGWLELKLSAGTAGLALDTVLGGMGTAPHHLYPLGGGSLEGIERFFKQGFGFAGPSGFIDIGQPEELRFDPEPVSRDVWSYDSYLATALIAADGACMALGALKHDAFTYRCSLYNRHRRFGLTDRRPSTHTAFLDAGFLTEEIAFGPDGFLTLPTLRFQTGPDTFSALENLASEIALVNGVRPDKKARYHYCSWYEHEYRFNKEKLSDLLNGLEKIKPGIPFQTIQIDAGHCILGDWLESNERWPGGMKHAFSMIHRAGYVPGIWIGPFMVNTTSRLYREHPDWLLHDREGKVIVEWEQDTHGEGSVCVLDSSHPGAFAYLRKVFRTLREWGAGYFKTDFMDWGYRDSTRVSRHSPGKTSAAYFHEVVEMIREEIGSSAFWLGCISPLAPMIGYIDAFRVSNDVSPNWSRGSTLNMFREMFYGQYFNNILWQNDPDVFYLRDYDNNLNRDEMESLAYWSGFTGGVINTSDSAHRYGEEQLRFLRFLEPPEKAVNAEFYRWDKSWDELVVATRRLLNGDRGLLVLNLSEERKEVELELADISGSRDQALYRWVPGKLSGRKNTTLVQAVLEPHQSALFYLGTPGSDPHPGITIHGEERPGIAFS